MVKDWTNPLAAARERWLISSKSASAIWRLPLYIGHLLLLLYMVAGTLINNTDNNNNISFL